MKLRLLLLFIFCSILKLHGQSVEDVRAYSNGKIITINYELLSAAPKNFVRVQYTVDNGKTFSKDLSFVTGDIGEVKDNGLKTILWGAEKEIVSYEGDIQFKVILESENDVVAPTVSTIESNYIKEDSEYAIEITSIEKLKSSLIIKAKITFKRDIETSFTSSKTKYASYVDESGKEYFANDLPTVNGKSTKWKTFSAKSTAEIQFEFSIDTDTNLKELKSLSIPIQSNYDNYKGRLFTFQNLSVKTN